MVEFQLLGAPANKRFYWLIFEKNDVDVCTTDPGHDVNLWVSSSIQTLVQLWLGHRKYSTALADHLIQLDGDKSDIATFRQWFTGSPFAKVGALPPAIPVATV